MESKIRELTDLEDFKNVYKVFSEEPYNEKYTDEELENIFNEYNEKGFIYGVYSQTECVGLIAFERGTKAEHPVRFDVDKVMYLADIAVLNKNRRNGLGNQLMMYGILESKLQGYNKMYMRTLKSGSMSYGIARRAGFKVIEGAEQLVERERTNGSKESMANIFLELDLDMLTKEKIQSMFSKLNNNDRGVK